MRFPEKESEVAALTFLVAQGMANAPEDYPHPPVAPDALLALHAKYQNVIERIAMAEAGLGALHAEKDGVYADMKAGTKNNLRYGEIKARGTPEKLTGLGWGPPREKRPLGVPGEVRDITVGHQGETTVEFSWRAPLTGGEVATYVVERRNKGGKWGPAAVIGDLRIILEDQPRGVDLEYRVKGVNKAGMGRESGTVEVVL